MNKYFCSYILSSKRKEDATFPLLPDLTQLIKYYGRRIFRGFVLAPEANDCIFFNYEKVMFRRKFNNGNKTRE